MNKISASLKREMRGDLYLHYVRTQREDSSANRKENPYQEPN